MSDPYIYKQLNTKTLKSVTASDIQSLTDPTHIEFNNQFDFERYNLINKAVMRDGSPMPNGTKIVSTTFTDNNRGVVFTVGKGEVYQLITVGAIATNPSGANTYQFYQTGINTDGVATNIKWFYLSTTANPEPVFQSDADFPDMPMYYDENTNMELLIGGTIDSVVVSVCMIRVR